MALLPGLLTTTVISTEPLENSASGSNDVEYYGGYLVAESVPPKLVSLLSFAHAAAEFVEGVSTALTEAQSSEELAFAAEHLLISANILLNVAGLRPALTEAREAGL